MFNSLYNSLFGKSKDNNSDCAGENKGDLRESDQTRALTELDSNVTAILLDDEKDWLFVEKEGDDQRISIEKTPNNLQLVPYKNILSHLGSIREYDENCFLSANLPSLYPNSMDDSWFLTPPECFSSVSAFQLESSPLENLLIEHPSMSVYYNFRRSSLNAIANGDGIEDLVVLELTQNDIDEERSGRASNKNRDKRNKKSRSSGAQKNIALVLLNKTHTQKPQDQRKTPKSSFERNNKCYVRCAPKRTTVINQPSSRMMMVNKKN